MANGSQEDDYIIKANRYYDDIKRCREKLKTETDPEEITDLESWIGILDYHIKWYLDYWARKEGELNEELKLHILKLQTL